MIPWLDRTLVVNPYYFCLCTTKKQYKKVLRKIKLDKKQWPEFIADRAHAMLHTFETPTKMFAVVCFRPNKNYTAAQQHGLLVHEATHLWQKIRTHYGEDMPSNEFEAYAVQTLSQRLIESFIEQTEKT